MTPPMTPREKVEDRGPVGAIMDALRPILNSIHMNTETWSRISDAVSTALASGSGDHAELAGKLRSRTDSIVETPLGPFRSSKGRLRNPDGPKAADALEALLAENAALGERLETARIARAAHNRQHGEAERKLAEAVGLLERGQTRCSDFDHWRVVEVFFGRKDPLPSKEAERG